MTETERTEQPTLPAESNPMEPTMETAAPTPAAEPPVAESSEEPIEQPSAEPAAPSIEEPAQFLARISSLSPDEAGAAMQALAAEWGPQAVPLLQHVAEKGSTAFGMSVIEALAAIHAPESAAVLGGLGADRSNPSRAKEARRALHQLNLAGIKSDVVVPVARPEPEPDRIYACLASAMDGEGSYSITVARQNRFNTLRMGVFLLSQETGVEDVYGADPCSMTMWKRYLNESNDGDQKLEPVELAFCQRQVETATRRNERSKTKLPERFFPFSALLVGASEERPRPAELQPDVIKGDGNLLAKSGDLFHLPECETWLFSFDKVKPYAQRLMVEIKKQQEAEQRQPDLPVMDLSTVQREGTLVSIAMNELLDGAQRAQFQERLEYTADLLWRADKRDEAQWALAAAQALAPESTLPVDQHPLLREAMLHSLNLAMEAEAAGITPGGGSSAGDASKEEGTPNEPDEQMDEQGFIRRKSGLILPK